MTRHRRARDDTGASMLMALGLTMFLGLMIGSLLTYSAAGLRTGKATDSGTTNTYDLDGALKTAVNQIRNSDYNNDEGATLCPDLDVPASDGTPIRVTCAPATTSGGSSERVAITTANRPGQAVLTLGTKVGETGIGQESGTAFPVQGKVFSAGPISAGAGSLESIDSAIVAKGSCTGTVISRDASGEVVPTVCDAPATGFPADPAYARPTSGLTYRALPVCDASSTVEFLPGYYDDAVGLSDMMDGVGPCAGKTFLFTANATTVGYYYFDFHNGEGGGLPTGSRVWTINDPDAEVIGGTPQGWVPDVSAPAVPGACISPLTSTTNKGVQFIFGGDSRIRLTAGGLEVCGQYATTPPFAMFGTVSGSDTVTSSTLVTNGLGTNPTAGPEFTNPARITTTDNIAATALVDASANTAVTASVVVDLPVTAIPAGSVLTSAKLYIVHRDNNADSTSRLALLQVSAAPLRAGAPALTGVPQPKTYVDGPAGTVYHSDILDVLPSLAAEMHDYPFVGLRVRYDAGAVFPNVVTENLDSIKLILSYKKAAVRGQAVAITGVNGVASTVNCVGAFPGCPLLETDAGRTELSLQGTLYAPLATVNLRLTNAPAVLIRSGIVVRSLRTAVTPEPDFTGPLIEIPTVSTGAQSLDVYFRAYVAGKVLATARVRFATAGTFPADPPTPGRRNITVVSWTIRRN